MQRVVVVGGPGSGKSTLAAILAEHLKARHVELDRLWWDAGWTPAGRGELRHRLAQTLVADRWVIDGNYVDEVADLVWPAADIIVWLNPARHVAVRRAVLRSGVRAVRRSELWNGNRQSIVALSPWAIARLVHRWPGYSQHIARKLTQLAIADEQVVHLDSDAAVDRWVRGLRCPGRWDAGQVSGDP